MPMLHTIPDDEPDYSDQLLPRASSPSTLQGCTLPPEYFLPPPPVEIPLTDKAKIKKMKKKDEDEEDFAEEDEDGGEVMEIDPENGFPSFIDIKKEEPEDGIIWEDVGDPDDIIEIEEVGPNLSRSRRNSNESAVSSTTGNSRGGSNSNAVKEEMERRKEYREYKRRLRARRLAKRNSNNGNDPSKAGENSQPQTQSNEFVGATASTSANLHFSNYFQSPPQNEKASAANGFSTNIEKNGNNFQQQFPSQQKPTSGFQQPQPSGSNPPIEPEVPLNSPNNNPQPEAAALNANAAPNIFSNPNNSIHIDLSSMPQFSENNNSGATGAGGRGDSRGARFAIYLGNDKVPALNLVVTPQNGNENTATAEIRPQPPPAAAAAAGIPTPTKSNEAVQREHRLKIKSSSHAPVFQSEAELIQIIRYCKCCDISFGSRREAMDHQKREHDRKFCHCCFKLLRYSGNEWKDHMNARHQEDSKERAKCPFCGILHNFEGIYLHISRTHLKPVENENEGQPPLLTPPREVEKKRGRGRPKGVKNSNSGEKANAKEKDRRRKDQMSCGVSEEMLALVGQLGTTLEERVKLRKRKEMERREREEKGNEPVASTSPIAQERKRQAAAAAGVKPLRPPPQTVPKSGAELRITLAAAVAAADQVEPPAKIRNLDNVRQESVFCGSSHNASHKIFQTFRPDYIQTPNKNETIAQHCGISQRVNAFLNNVFQQSPAPPDAAKYKELRAETGVNIENLKNWFERRYKEYCRAKNRK